MPANYDVALFTDIAQAFNTVGSTDDLEQLSAEFAGDAYAPSVFSPSVFSPSVFSPSVFSPSVFSPSVFSPSVFSPSVFSPSVFSPSVFSPSVFSPSVFSPSVFSPSVFSDGQAYESAQVRSLLAVSANDGTAGEHLSVDTWNNTGEFYVRIAGRNGAHSPGAPFDLAVHLDASSCTDVTPSEQPLAPTTPAPAPGGGTLIIVDYGRMNGDLVTMQDRLETLAAHAVSTGGSSTSGPAHASPSSTSRPTRTPACPYAKNLVAEAIRDIVVDYRDGQSERRLRRDRRCRRRHPLLPLPRRLWARPGVRLRPAGARHELRRRPACGSTTTCPRTPTGRRPSCSSRASRCRSPICPVGRLVETPAEITGMIDAFLADSVLNATSSLVTGYDFLTDGASAVQTSLRAGVGAAGADSLITNQGVPPTNVGPPPGQSWNADQLRTALFGERHDIVYLAGHFSANNLLAADYTTTVNANELTASNVNLTNSLVFSAGCHSGYSVVDGDAVPNVTQTLDWIQALAQKRATVIAGTGYQYGDTDFLEYSERLYKNLAEAFRFGTGAR